MAQAAADPDEQKSADERIGQRIRVDNHAGPVRYVGPVATSKKATTVWLGVEWDDDNRGKNDGSVQTADGQNHRYFTTKPGKASFIKPVKAKFGIDLRAAINERFSLDVLCLQIPIQILARTLL